MRAIAGLGDEAVRAPARDSAPILARGRPRGERRLGAVYTPTPIATWLAQELVKRLPVGRTRVVLDPACGDGALLTAVAAVDQGAELVGVDVDERAIHATRRRLPSVRAVCGDALVASWDPSGLGISGVIANPPWGADLAHSRGALSLAGYSLASGQFDSYELFVERAVDQLPPGAVAAFLVPDSLLLPEHEELRRLLVERTQLELVVRLGEGIFDGVFRGTVALVFRVGQPSAGHAVRCCRVRDGDRRRVLSGAARLEAVVAAHGHDVLQSHFASADATFDVDVTEAERATLDRMRRGASVWSSWLRPFRGVELGKAGLVVVCRGCGDTRPAPRRDRDPGRCRACGTRSSGKSEIIQIIRDRDRDRARDRRRESAHWHPIVVGEDVGRYACQVRREIRLHVPGIAYKAPDIFVPRKLLVRKTGVGIHATLEDSGALTTQTVFHFLPTQEAPDFALHYTLGVLSSRAVLAYHLKRTGDDEWRSHPYVTPRTLMALPVPLPVSGTQRWRQAVSIADAVAGLLAASPRDRPALDLRVERLVAGLFGFDRVECSWVDDVLGGAQQLQAIAAMRVTSGETIYPDVAPDMSYRYIGNKTRVLPQLMAHVRSACRSGGVVIDPMCGTASVAAALRAEGYTVIASDLMTFAVQHALVRLKLDAPPRYGGLGMPYADIVSLLNGLQPSPGYLYREYSGDGAPAQGCPPRKYLTGGNAAKLDAIQRQLSTWQASGHLAPIELALLRHDIVLAVNRIANIAGTYGHFRSSWSPTALKPLELRASVFEPGPTQPHQVLQGPAEEVVDGVKADLCYLDPPYMKRQYAANYHLIETIARGDEPEAIGISGLRDWWDQYSDFCSKRKIADAFAAILSKLECPRFLISYSEDGLLSREQMVVLLSDFGSVRVSDFAHTRFRSNGSPLGRELREFVFDVSVR